jgi:hypothetical protein
MKVIRNLTRRPLRVPLPGGKLLHLGPGKEGRVGDDAVVGALKRMIDEGEIVLVDAHGSDRASGTEGGTVHASTTGHHPPTVVRPKGDR